MSNPALVSQRAVQKIPRWALLLLCAAYVLPGVFGRDPWKSADLTAFGYMVNMAMGKASWLAPQLGGIPADGALIPYWLGALFIQGLSPLVEPALAARIPFALLLALALALCWYTTYHLACTENAQPVPFAFGGEAAPVDYARTIADASVLAMMATLGLLRLGHETTPELVQMVCILLYTYGLAAAPFRPTKARWAVLIALPALASSGGPSVALTLGTAGLLICVRSGIPVARRLWPWALASLVLAGLAGSATGAWAWRVEWNWDADRIDGMTKALLWFAWPVWPMALWTLYRWRQHWAHRHIAIPLAVSALFLSCFMAMGGSDRALMLGMPTLGILAAFSLPTLQRATAAAIDWFSLIFITVCAAAIWVVYVAMHTGHPWQPAANVQRLLPGFTPTFSWLALSLAVLGTLAWLALVRWRTRGHAHPLWKSLVLPSGGVALCWLLLNTLWLPALDYARSYRPLVSTIKPWIPARSCIDAPGLNPALIAALEYLGPYPVRATQGSAPSCPYVLVRQRRGQPRPLIEGLQWLTEVSHPADKEEVVQVFRRNTQTQNSIVSGLNNP